MKKIILLLVLKLILLNLSSAYAVFVTGFGSGNFNITYSSYTTNQTATYLDIIGNDFSSQLNGDFAPVSVSSNLTQALLKGTNLGGAPSTLFAVRLFDSANNILRYDGYWSSFPLNVPTTITLVQYSADPGWNGTAVKLEILPGGLGDPIHMRLHEFSVIPEPSVVWMFGIGIFLVLTAHKSFKNRLRVSLFCFR